jgi:NAD(P)H-hydrate epimerase
MAVGGSGDVLAGMVTSLIGQGIPPLEAAAVSVWLHGAAGDLAAKRLGQYPMLPSDLLDELSQLMK